VSGKRDTDQGALVIAYYIPIDKSGLDSLEKDDAKLEEYLSQALGNDDACFDIDKAWAAIHCLLCGSPEEGEGPLHDAILGGRPIGEEDFGIGPARVLDPAQVAEAAKALEAVDFSAKAEEFRTTIIGRSDVYPGYEDEDGFNYVEYNFGRLRDFFAGQAGEGCHLILCLA
jgi:hypothetical protein